MGILSGITPHGGLQMNWLLKLAYWRKIFSEGKADRQKLVVSGSTWNQVSSGFVLIDIFPESSLKKVYISSRQAKELYYETVGVGWTGGSDFQSWPKFKIIWIAGNQFISLVHAIAAAFKNTGLNSEWAFRDDAEGGSALYLWKIPEIEEGSTVTISIWRVANFGGIRKTWVVMLNQQPFVPDSTKSD